MEGKIDIYDIENRYRVRLENFQKDKANKNKDFILDFLRDCELGKTVKNRGKKKIGTATRLKSLIYLDRISRWVGKPFNQITQNEFEEFILDLERGKFKRAIDNRPFTERTKVGYKEVIRKFFEWMNHAHKLGLDISFIDTTSQDIEIPAISYEELQKMAGLAPNVRTKFIVKVLFDSGARIEEFLNMRIDDLWWDDELKCYVVRIRISKTKPRTISLPLSTKEINEYFDYLKASDEYSPERPLVTLRYDAVRMLIGRLSKRVLNKAMSPHDFRHASATYYARKLSYFPFCYRYGWTFNSSQPRRYIDRNGLQERDTAKIIHNDEIGKFKDESQQLKENLARLSTENKEVWKWVEKLAITNHLMLKAITQDTRVEKDFKKQLKEVLSDSDSEMRHLVDKLQEREGVHS